jgi:perosamine synthetase
LAALGVAQLEQLDGILIHKKSLSDTYKKSLAPITGIHFQEVSESVQPNNWLFTVRVPDQKGLIQHLLENKIQVRPFWVPMNQLPMFKEVLYISNNDVSSKIYDSSLSLPCSAGLTFDAQAFVIDKIIEFYNA